MDFGNLKIRERSLSHADAKSKPRCVPGFDEKMSLGPTSRRNCDLLLFN